MKDELSGACAEIEREAQQRSTLLFGTRGLERLKRSHVLVVGCGAVGGMALEALARTGVGNLTVVDCDVFEASNLNRQILATRSVLGQPKTCVAAQRIHAINPHIHVIEKQIEVGDITIHSVLEAPVDYVIDAIDSLHAKTVLIKALVERKIPFISAMGAALKTDITRIRVAPMKKTIQCPLAAFVRKRLRRQGIDLSFPVVYSDECVADKAHLGEIDETNGRHTMGSLVTVTGMFGLMCAHEAIMHIIKDEK